MNKNMRRSVVALATAFASLALMSNPASANPAHSATVTGGNIHIVRTNLTTEDIALGGTGTCSSNIVITHTQTSPNDTVDITTFATEGRFNISTSASTFIAVLTRTGSTPGNINTTTNAITGVGLTVQADIYNTVNTTDCTRGTRACRLNVSSITFSGSKSAGALATGSTATLTSTGGTISIVPPCTAVFTNLGGGTVTVQTLALVLTT